MHTPTNSLFLPPDVKDILLRLTEAGNAKGRELLHRYGNLDTKESVDKDLKHPYEAFVNYCLDSISHGVKVFNSEIERIRDHVNAAYDIWLLAMSKIMNEQGFPNAAPGAKSKSMSKRNDNASWAAAQAYAQPIADIRLTPNVEEVKASYAYKRSPNFAFSVAFEELCCIKARASPGGRAPNLRIFDEAKTFSSSFMRALNRREDEHGT